ncbi:MAG: ATP-binding protein, partial [Candidatus Thorarchaeota archaeon]
VHDYSLQTSNKAPESELCTGELKCYKLLHNRAVPCDGQKFPCPMEVVKATRSPAVVEHVFYDDDHLARYVEIHAYPIFDSEGSLTHLIEYHIDVTEKKWAEKQLETESRRSQLYLDLMAHDIANKIQAMGMAIQLLEEIVSPSDDETISSKNSASSTSSLFDLLRTSYRECKTIISLVRNIEQLSMVPLVERNLSRVIIDSINYLGQQHDDFLLSLDYHVDDAIIFADKFLELLLEIVLDNALVHSTSKKRSVWVSLRQRNGGYEIEVADNGKGIDDISKMDIFNPYHRVGGINVHFVFDIIEKYCGRINVHDRVEGDYSQGAKITLWFPPLRRKKGY